MNLIIVGCGRIGSELAEDACADGHHVIVIDREPAAFERLSNEFTGRTIQGDARDRAVMMRAEIETADGLAALTSSDEMNLVVASIAKKIFDVPNVVARVYEPCHQEVFRLAGLQTVISSSWGAHRIEQLLTHPGQHELASLGHHELSLVEVQVPNHLVGQPVNALDLAEVCRVVAVVRGGHAELVQDDSTLAEDDLVVLSVLNEAWPQVESLLAGEA